MKSILLLTQMFPPETGAASHRMKRLVAFFHAKGISVDVVSWFPHYPQRAIYPEYSGWYHSEQLEGGRVRRFRPVIPKPTMIRRMLAELWLTAGASVLGLLGTRPDTVYATTPSPLLGLAGWLVASLRGARFVLEFRDLTWRYPAGVADRELSRLESLVESIMVWVARRAYRLVTTTQAQADFFLQRGVDKQRVLVVSNGVTASELDESLAPPRRGDEEFTVLYTGLVGLPQGLGVLVNAAALLRDRGVQFVVVGDGLEKPRLAAQCKELSLTNVQFVPSVPRSALRRYYEDADVLFAHLKGSSAFETALPSKILDYMATGRPIIFGGRGVAAAVIQSAEAGVVIEPDDPAALAQAIMQLKEDRAGARQIGLNGYEHVRTHYVSESLFETLYKGLEHA